MRLRALLAVVGMAATLCGCVYDPYTGSYAPCCSYYGNPYGYGYPYGYGGYRPP